MSYFTVSSEMLRYGIRLFAAILPRLGTGVAGPEYWFSTHAQKVTMKINTLNYSVGGKCWWQNDKDNVYM